MHKKNSKIENIFIFTIIMTTIIYYNNHFEKIIIIILYFLIKIVILIKAFTFAREFTIATIYYFH